MNKGLIISIIATLGLIGLFIWINEASRVAPEDLVAYKNTSVKCLPNGHQQLALHIHPILEITVDGELEKIPANIAIDGTCMAEIHTHDETGVLHIETVAADRINDFSLATFFEVAEMPVEREGYDVAFFMDGQAFDKPEDIPFIDQSLIEVQYTSQQTEAE